jgi:hypothetical protein
MKLVTKLAKLAALSAIIVAATGCSKPFYLVETKYVQADMENTKPEVIKTTEYTDTIKNVKTIAVAAPERCKNETASTSTGQTANNDVIMKTECGTEMGEIERALARAGYQVISWQIIANAEKMAAIAKKNITRQDIAKEKGAEVLFQISSLERTMTGNSGNARWDRKFYNSDKYGAALEAAQVDSRLQKGLTSVSQVQEKAVEQAFSQRLSATIDASAISVSTGRAIWFYQSTLSETIDDKNIKFEQLALCKKNRCKAINPKKEESDDDIDDKLTSGNSTAISMEQKNIDQQRAIYHQLLRDSIKNMVSTFQP